MGTDVPIDTPCYSGIRVRLAGIDDALLKAVRWQYLLPSLLLVACASDGSAPCVPLEKVAACQVDDSFCEAIEGAEACDTTKADGDTTDGFPDWWLEQTAACYKEGDLNCVKRYFRILQYGGSLQGYPYASRAVGKFLDCETQTLEILGEDLQEGEIYNIYLLSDPNVVSLHLAKEKSLTALKAWLAQVEPFMTPDGPSELVALESVLTTSGSEDIRKTVGRFYLQVMAEARLSNDRLLEYELFFTLEDRYDWHPTRLDDDGVEYGELHPYHTWANALVEAGMACEFDVHSSWSMSGTLSPDEL